MADYDYTHEFSNYPDSLIDMKTFKDINDDIASIVSQIEAAKAEGYYDDAIAIIKEHPELADYDFSANDINRIIEEIRNSQIFVTTITDAITYGNDEFRGSVGDIWIGKANFEEG